MIPERQSDRKEIGPLIAALLLALAVLLGGCRGRETAQPTPAVGPTAAPAANAQTDGQIDDQVDDQIDAGQAVIVPTWTASPAPQAATSTPMPVITPTATPTNVPQQRLAEGRAQLRLQNYAMARAALTSVADDPSADPNTRWEALFSLARVDWEEGLVVEALATLDRLLAELAVAPETSEMLATKARFLRGDILSTSGFFSEAIAEYWLVLELLPELSEVVQQRIARAYLALGDFDAAAAAYRRAADAVAPADGEKGDVVTYVLLLESLAETYNGAGRYGDAVGAYDDILSVAVQSHYRAEIQFRAGQALAAAGNVPGAVERWLAATDEAPESGSAYSALIELVNRDVAFDLYQRGAIDLYAGAWTPAISAYEAFLESASPTDARYPAALSGVGQAYAGAENYAAALPYFERVIDDYPECDCAADAWLGKASAETMLGDPVAARRTYRTFAREQPAHPLAPEALWRSALMALDRGEEIEAGLDLLTLADAFPESERAPVALYIVALGAFRQGLEAQSASTFARLQRQYPDYRWDAVGYWQGRALQAEGKVDEAEVTWQELVDRAPDIYYGVLAAHALRGEVAQHGDIFDLTPENHGPTSTLTGDDGSRAFAEEWLAGWLQPDGAASDLSQLPPAIADDTDLAAGRILLAAGDRSAALAQLEHLFYQFRDEPNLLYPLLLEYERLGVHRLAISAAAYLLQLSPALLVEETPIYLQQMAYPRHFEPLIVQEALAHDLDPNLYFSLIRQESLFEEGARSTAAAQGLAQIIPDTGSWVANRLGVANYSNELVYRPDINLKFGAYYLDWARDYLDGNLISALVGYNAGPGNAERWRESVGQDDALYVELLEYSEPRAYIRAILSNFYHYSRLYGDR